MSKFDFGDKVLLNNPKIEGVITCIAFRTYVLYEVQYFNDKTPITYWAYDWELSLVESFTEKDP